MSNYDELKRLAEAAPKGPWYGPDKTAHRGTVFDCDLGSLLCYESIESEQDACVAYVAAANPAAVLALIAENEALRKDADRYRWLREPARDVGLVLDKKTGHVPVDDMGFGGYGIYEYRAGEELDGAIDAAMGMGEQS